MDTMQIQDSRMFSLVRLYDLHSQYFYNVLDGISDQDAHNRLQTKANHIAWIAGSLVYESYLLAHLLNKDTQLELVNKGAFEIFKDHKGIQDNVYYPSLKDYHKEWDNIRPVLRHELANLDKQKLASPDPYEMPGQSSTLYDSVCFLIDRESYCIGQIALYRRLLDYPAMKYS